METEIPPVDIIGILSGYGVPYVLLGIAILGLIALFRALIKSWSDRLADAKTIFELSKDQVEGFNALKEVIRAQREQK